MTEDKVLVLIRQASAGEDPSPTFVDELWGRLVSASTTPHRDRVTGPGLVKAAGHAGRHFAMAAATALLVATVAVVAAGDTDDGDRVSADRTEEVSEDGPLLDRDVQPPDTGVGPKPVVRGVGESTSGLSAPLFRRGAAPGRSTAYADQDSPPDADQIVFVSNRDEDRDWEIFIMNSDGSNVRQLTDNRVGDFGPRVSPNGSRVLFSSNGEGHRQTQVYVMNIDGSGRRRVTHTSCARADYRPDQPFCLTTDAAWMPDGERIVFVSGFEFAGCDNVVMTGGANECARLWTMKLDGTELRPLGPGWAPDVSLDGRHISFVARPAGARAASCDAEGWLQQCEGELHVMNADGSGRRSLNQSAGANQWSPDGSSIVFNSTNGTFVDAENYVIKPDGSGKRAVTASETAMNRQPGWSPDGDRLVFLSNRDGNWEIYVSDADGKATRRITNHPATEAQPQFVSTKRTR